jgi:hypothetical protein
MALLAKLASCPACPIQTGAGRHFFGDYDNDGYKDLFVTNGYVKDYTEMDFMKYSIDRLIRSMNKDTFDAIPNISGKCLRTRFPATCFKNNGNETFTKKSSEWGIDQPGVGSGAAYADLDNDGDLDLIVNKANDYAAIIRTIVKRTKKIITCASI